MPPRAPLGLTGYNSRKGKQQKVVPTLLPSTFTGQRTPGFEWNLGMLWVNPAEGEEEGHVLHLPNPLPLFVYLTVIFNL